MTKKPYFHELLYNVNEDAPATGPALRRHMNNTICGYPASSRDDVLNQVIKQGPALRQMISFAKRKKKASHLDYKAVTQRRHSSAAETLNQLWNGRNWLPPWLKHTGDTPASYNQLSSPDLSYILATSKLASANGVDLPSLYQPNGVFYQAAASIKFPLR
ncbi:hypothetical protein ACHAPU_010142 [Fusarium lateritium]